ncbi:ATPase subunit of ABC transporter with duplicated ATPase domains [Thermosporothrix hazakensis]|jgi:ATPase subunit of ABC transporter with duplicated ATPase domains|uniref:ATPase subunit of ABC transporter with duplicated ATPase domains n=2 Tax=Thermosporothrix TaxID=768650 RepID=A0A326U308_THEHA|nr:ABC-F family ATP-binding cassette domain-containing protein [Thermosporothrix hazakensis]PZW26303.1 ATPase subunit of ABC transporter with duplicated ATPase domains [Thermosporothrix hazakensis]BBH90694.1 ABC transporter ATP-binding protein [Thermosporothrix sp. COM3]GCE48745.1 ABC transporter ATP-binding protein [Thermosporothrix hazakensis]
MLQVKGIQLAYGPRQILEDVSFTIGPGEKVGLIGVNGAGKSSLLKIIAGLQDSDSGTVSRPRSFGYLSQDIAHEDPVAEGKTVRDFIFSSTGLDRALAQYEEISAALASADAGELETLLQRLATAQDALERLGYYEADARCEELIAGLNIGGVTLDRQVSSLSGGQKTKLALVRLLFQSPELLLLDEPTNFLDVEASAWLMDFLGSYKGSILIISHDLDLLDRNIHKILRLNEFTHKIEEYRGTYSNYLTQTGDALALMERTRRWQERELARLRKTSQQLRRFGATRVSQRRAIDKRIEALEQSMPVLPQNSRRIKVDFRVRVSSERVVLVAEDLCKSYGEKEIFRNLRLEVERGQRLVIVGRNGAGKTTLLRSLLGLTTLNQGEVIFGDRVRIGYYAQENEGLNYENTVINEAGSILPDNMKRVRSILGCFLFTGDRVFQPVGTLSGGEKTRLALAKMVLDGPNLLVLDEPTTHLDAMSRGIVGEALAEYNGTIIAVTHDLEFVRYLKPDTLLLMPEGRIVLYDEKYDQLLQRA